MMKLERTCVKNNPTTKKPEWTWRGTFQLDINSWTMPEIGAYAARSIWIDLQRAFRAKFANETEVEAFIGKHSGVINKEAMAELVSVQNQPKPVDIKKAISTMSKEEKQALIEQLLEESV